MKPPDNESGGARKDTAARYENPAKRFDDVVGESVNVASPWGPMA